MFKAKTPSKSGSRGTGKATSFARKGKIAIHARNKGSAQQSSAGVRPVSKQSDGSRQHSFSEGKAAHIAAHKHVVNFNNAKGSEGKELLSLHTKSQKKGDVQASQRKGGTGKPSTSTIGL